jgi:hypothetical protein
MESPFSPEMTKYVLLLISIILSYLMFAILTPWVFSDLNNYKLQNMSKIFSKQLSIQLIKGVCPFGSKTTINTSIPTTNDFINLPVSVNKDSGVEFSYSFWMKLNQPSDQIVFMKGINNTNPINLTAKTLNGTLTEHSTLTNDKLVKCPMVSFKKDVNEPNEPIKIQVSFNTLKKINNQIEFKYSDILESSTDNPRWFAFSIVFKEANFQTEYGLQTKGVVVHMYVNERHVESKFIENDSLKTNDGDLHIFPGLASSESNQNKNMFGDLTYHNFALDISDVEKIWRKGYNSSGCSTVPAKVINTQLNELEPSGSSTFANN